jgi:hypothetical protein
MKVSNEKPRLLNYQPFCAVVPGVSDVPPLSDEGKKGDRRHSSVAESFNPATQFQLSN